MSWTRLTIYNWTETLRICWLSTTFKMVILTVFGSKYDLNCVSISVIFQRIIERSQLLRELLLWEKDSWTLPRETVCLWSVWRVQEEFERHCTEWNCLRPFWGRVPLFHWIEFVTKKCTHQHLKLYNLTRCTHRVGTLSGMVLGPALHPLKSDWKHWVFEASPVPIVFSGDFATSYGNIAFGL